MGGAGTRRLSARGVADCRDRRNPGQLAQSRNGCLIVDIDVVPARCDKAREGGRRAAPGGCGGQSQSGHEGDQDDQDQPGAPSTAKLNAEHQPDCAQDDLPAPVLFTEPVTSKVATCSSPVVVAPSPWRGAVTTTHATAYPELSSRTAIPNGHFKRGRPRAIRRSPSARQHVPNNGSHAD